MCERRKSDATNPDVHPGVPHLAASCHKGAAVDEEEKGYLGVIVLTALRWQVVELDLDALLFRKGVRLPAVQRLGGKRHGDQRTTALLQRQCSQEGGALAWEEGTLASRPGGSSMWSLRLRACVGHYISRVGGYSSRRPTPSPGA